jgi:uncharacterized protein YbaP (TraB family)
MLCVASGSRITQQERGILANVAGLFADRRAPRRLRLFAAALLLGASTCACADENLHTLWAVKGNHNTVYLLGSVHALKSADSDLPPEAMRAYASAKALVMEIDLNDVSADKRLGAMLDLEALPAGQTLESALGPDAYGKFVARAKVLGLDPGFVSHFQPWFAATMLDQLALARLGLDPESGVDRQLAKRAQADHKDIIGLETVEEQMGMLAHLSLDDQRHYVLQSLDDVDQASSQLDAMVAAWRRGDTKALEQLLGSALKEFPDLYSKLTTDRNRKWLPTITGLLKDDRDYLVVVGALHLVGKDGLVALLQRGGYEVVQN